LRTGQRIITFAKFVFDLSFHPKNCFILLLIYFQIVKLEEVIFKHDHGDY